MDPLFWLWFLALGLPIVLWLARPWRTAEQELRPVSPQEQHLSELLARKEAIMDALAELEVDFRAGKLPEEDYQRLKANLVQQGAAVLKELDELQVRMTSQPPKTTERPRSRETREREGNEEDVPAPRPKATSTPSPTLAASTPSLEELLTQRRAQGQARFVGFCPSCGAALRVGQRFCHWCGQPVPEEMRKSPTPTSAR